MGKVAYVDRRENLLTLLDEIRDEVEAGKITALGICGTMGPTEMVRAVALLDGANVVALLGSVSHFTHWLHDRWLRGGTMIVDKET